MLQDRRQTEGLIFPQTVLRFIAFVWSRYAAPALGRLARYGAVGGPHLQGRSDHVGINALVIFKKYAVYHKKKFSESLHI
jgi:hypothetical protein